jgi:hypothetical protein
MIELKAVRLRDLHLESTEQELTNELVPTHMFRCRTNGVTFVKWNISQRLGARLSRKVRPQISDNGENTHIFGFEIIQPWWITKKNEKPLFPGSNSTTLFCQIPCFADICPR